MRARFVPALGLALALLAMSVGSAMAVAKPDRVPVELPDSIDFAAGEVCDFPVHLVFTTNREFLTIWYDADGNPIRDNYTGTLRIRITNEDTGAWADLNIGGPGGDYYAADGSSVEDFKGHGFPVLPGFEFDQTVGNVRYAFDSEGNPTLLYAHGRSVDACALVAG
jgi:hypothetical protein